MAPALLNIFFGLRIRMPMGLYLNGVPLAKDVSDIGFTEITPVKELKEGSKIVVKKTFFIIAKMVNTAEEE